MPQDELQQINERLDRIEERIGEGQRSHLLQYHANPLYIDKPFKDILQKQIDVLKEHSHAHSGNKMTDISYPFNPDYEPDHIARSGAMVSDNVHYCSGWWAGIDAYKRKNEGYFCNCNTVKVDKPSECEHCHGIGRLILASNHKSIKCEFCQQNSSEFISIRRDVAVKWMKTVDRGNKIDKPLIETIEEGLKD